MDSDLSLRKAKRRLISAGILAVILPCYCWCSIVAAVDGGFRGTAMLSLVPFIALSAAILGIGAGRKLARAELRGRVILCAIIVVVTLPVGLIATFVLMGSQIGNPVSALAPSENSEPFHETRIVYRNQRREFWLADPGSRMRFRFGPPPASVEVRDSVRIVAFDQPVVLQSWADTIEFGPNATVVHGYWDLVPEATYGAVIVDQDGRIVTTGGH